MSISIEPAKDIGGQTVEDLYRSFTPVSIVGEKDLEMVKLKILCELGKYVEGTVFCSEGKIDRSEVVGILEFLVALYLQHDLVCIGAGTLQRNTRFAFEGYAPVWEMLVNTPLKDRPPLLRIIDSLTCFSSAEFSERVGVEAAFEVWDGNSFDQKTVVCSIPMWLHNIFELLVVVENVDFEEFIANFIHNALGMN